MRKLIALLIVLLVPVQSYADITSNLEVYWKMDDGSGSTVTDSSGNGRNGTFAGTAGWGVGRDGGGAASLNGSDAYIVSSDSAFNFTTGNFTISFWLNRALSNSPFAFVKGDGIGFSGYSCQLVIDGTVIFTTTQSGANQNTVSSAALGSSTWQLLTIVRNGSSVRVYVNAVDVTSTPATHANPDTSATQFNLGNYLVVTTPTYLMTGLLDDFRLYSRALSVGDVYQLYAGSKSQVIN